MKKYLEIRNEISGSKEKVLLEVKRYQEHGNMALNLVDEEGVPYSTITKFFREELPPFYAYVSNDDSIISFIENNKLGKYAGTVKKSGFCSYPLYQFDRERLKCFSEKSVARYEKGLANLKQRPIHKSCRR